MRKKWGCWICICWRRRQGEICLGLLCKR